MSGFADDSLIHDFVVESSENLDAIEPDLLAMEQEGASVSQETINRVFRAIHSMKGGAGFLAFERLKTLSHSMESVFMLVRDGKLAVSPPVMDVLLSGVDKLRAMVEDIHASETVAIEDDLQRLKAIADGQALGPAGGAAPAASGAAATTPPPAATVADAAAPTGFDLAADAVREAIEHGMSLYSIEVSLLDDILRKGVTPAEFIANVGTVGTCLDTGIDIDALPALEAGLTSNVVFTLLFATVLEEDLVSMALELPDSQVTALDTAAVKEQFLHPAAPAAAAPPAPDAALAAPAAAPPEALASSSPAPSAGPAAVEPPREARTAAQPASDTLRVRVDLLARLMNIAGELVLSRNQLLRTLEGDKGKVPGLQAILQNINLITTELQEGIMQTRMQPVGSIFSKFTRVVRDMARDLGKEIELEIEGAEVQLDKSIIEMLGDPLTHIIRNCCDHALEPPAERVSAGKSPSGLIQLRAYHEGGQVNVSIEDDGRGIDARRVLQKAIEKGVVSAAEGEKLSERDIINLVFAPGFSTAEKITEVSGRGVGMDVVRTNIEKLGGHIEMETAVGKGTTVLLRLPLTLAIIPSLVVGASNQRFAVPQVNLVELVWVRANEVKDRIERVHGASVLRLRGRLLPLVRIADVMGLPRLYKESASGEARPDRRENITDRIAPPGAAGTEADNGHERRDTGRPLVARSGQDRRQNWLGDYKILVLQVFSNQFGVIVDELFDMEEIVVKPLASFVQDCRCFAGATILGDGRVIMILDVNGLAEVAGLRFTDIEAEERRRLAEEARKAAESAAVRRSIILFNCAAEDFFAVPQRAVLRLDRVKPADIEQIGGREFIQYRGVGLPVLRLEQHLPVRPVPAESDDLYLIFPRLEDAAGGTPEPRVGIVASKIIDAVDVELSLEQGSLTGRGVEGLGIVQGNLTVFLDPVELIAGASTSTAGGRWP